jgi:hypothetical protein
MANRHLDILLFTQHSISPFSSPLDSLRRIQMPLGLGPAAMTDFSAAAEQMTFSNLLSPGVSAEHR